ncbi:MAG: GNAT family N-acetyltransferase [Eisenbergiella sp.]
MEIRKIADRKRYLKLASGTTEHDDRYLGRGTCTSWRGDGWKPSVVTDEGDGILEIKNIAVEPSGQRKGYGRRLIHFLEEEYHGRFHTLQAGTGDSPLTVPFYESCGFAESHRIRNFFTDNYDHPIYEGGRRLADMVYFRKKI